MCWISTGGFSALKGVSSLLFLLVETHPSFFEALLRDSLQVDAARSWFSDFMISSTQFCCSICEREHDVHPFWTLILLLHWVFEHGFLNRPIFQFLHVCNQYISLSTLLPRPMRVRGMFLARPSYLIGGASTGLMKKSDDVQPLLRTEWSILQMVLQIVSQKVSFPVGWEVLGVSQISTAFHGISPPFFIRAWSQQHCRCSFLFSAHCSFGNPIRLRSMRCRSTMISW